MSPSFLILGYGIPKNILEDENYGIYLKSTFNAIFDWCAAHDAWDPVILFSGGKTDMVKPYRRIEAKEMIRFFRALMKRPSVKGRVRGWKLVPESKSFSTLDNLLYAADLLRAQKRDEAELIIFGEKTREKRISSLAKKIFRNARFVPIDFDQSANRYLNPAFLKEKEADVLNFDLWALKDPKNLQEHRALFQKRFAFLRKIGPKHHVDAVRQWWEQELRELQKKAH